MRTLQYYFNQPLTANIERVEVIKGPASATFSSVDPGGSINLVTKKPLSVARKEVSFSVGSFSMLRGALDFTGPLNEDKTLRYRVNGAYQENKSFRDLQGQKALLISPSFSYVPNDRTAINAELIYNNTDSKLDRGQPIFGAVAGQTSLNSTPTSFAIGATNDFFKSKEVMLTGSLAHKFSDAISFNTAYMKQTWTENLWEHRATNRFAVDVDNNSIPTLAAMQVVERQQYWNIDNVNSYFNFDFKVGQTRSKFLVGYDLHAWNKRKGGGQNAARGYLLTDGTVAAAYDPAKRAQYQIITVQGVEMPRPNVAHFDLANPLYTIKQNNDYVFATRTALPAALTTTNSIYVQELFTWSRISVLAGLRHEWFEDITNYEAINQTIVRKTKLLPRVGITYAVHKYVNVYATYLEGFQPQSNTVTLMPVAAPAGSTFDPLTSDLKELGVKAELLDSRVNLTASLYEINQTNILMNANDATNPDLLVTRGAERSRGFEVDLAGYIIPHWQINASYSYIDAQIREDQNPDLIGKRKQNTPVHSSNLWTRYDFVSGRAPGNLGVGFGVQYSGDMVPWFTRDFTIPSFIIFDAALYYSPDKSDFQIALHANNLFNKTYWVGAQNYLRLFPGTPRSAMLTATYKF
jgi:iron complex outermembrane receptor protein